MWHSKTAAVFFFAMVALAAAGNEFNFVPTAETPKPAARPIANLQAVGQFADTHLGPVISKLVTGKAIPDDEEIQDHVHIQLSKMSVATFTQQGVSIDVDTTTNAPRLVESFDVTVKAHMNICTNMFGKCRTILGCAGDVTLDMTGTLTGEASLGADSAGRPTASVGAAALGISKFKLSGHIGVCDVAEKYLNAKRAEKTFGKFIPQVLKQVNAQLATKLAALPTKFKISDVVGIDWSLTGAPVATGNTVEYQSRAGIYMMKDGSYTPFDATDMVSAAPTDAKPVGLALHQSIGNGVLYGYYNAGLMTLSKEYTILKQKVQVDIGASAAPTLAFTPNGGVFTFLGSVALTVDGHKIATAGINVEADATIAFTRNSAGHPAVFADLKGASVNDLRVSIFKIKSVDVEFVRKGVNTLLEKLIPEVSKKLQTILIPLPSLESFTIGDADLGFASNYVTSVAALTKAA